jgi:hypothetical protein
MFRPLYVSGFMCCFYFHGSSPLTGLNITLANPPLLVDAAICLPLHRMCANYFEFQLIVALWIKQSRYRKFHITIINTNDIG